MAPQRPPSVSDDELSKDLRFYLAQGLPAPEDTLSIGRCDAVYRFWRQNKSAMPKLFSCAQYIFSIPCSSAEIERVFSTSGYVDQSRKASQTADTIRRLTKLNRNFKYAVNSGLSPFPWARSLSFTAEEEEGTSTDEDVDD